MSYNITGFPKLGLSASFTFRGTMTKSSAPSLVLNSLFSKCCFKFATVSLARLTFNKRDMLSVLKPYGNLVRSVGFELINADITVIAEQPKLGKFKSAMEANIASALNLTPSRINVKATTTEKLGFTGRGENIAATASASLKIYDWTQK